MSGHAWDGRDAETEEQRSIAWHRSRRLKAEAQVADLKARETQLLGALDDKHQDYLAALEEKRVAVELLESCLEICTDLGADAYDIDLEQPMPGIVCDLITRLGQCAQEVVSARAERDRLAERVRWLSAYVGRIEKQAEEAVAQAEELIRTCFEEPPPRRGLLDRVRDWLEEAAS